MRRHRRSGPLTVITALAGEPDRGGELHGLQVWANITLTGTNPTQVVSGQITLSR